MRGRAAVATTTAVTMVLFGCSGDTASRPTAQVADSSGVRIVTYDLTDVAVATYAILGENDLEIGELDGADGYQFSRVIDVAGHVRFDARKSRGTRALTTLIRSRIAGL